MLQRRRIRVGIYGGMSACVSKGIFCAVLQIRWTTESHAIDCIEHSDANQWCLPCSCVEDKILHRRRLTCSKAEAWNQNQSCRELHDRRLTCENTGRSKLLVVKPDSTLNCTALAWLSISNLGSHLIKACMQQRRAISSDLSMPFTRWIDCGDREHDQRGPMLLG